MSRHFEYQRVAEIFLRLQPVRDHYNRTKISDGCDYDRFNDYMFIFIVKQWIFQVCINYFKWRSKQDGLLRSRFRLISRARAENSVELSAIFMVEERGSNQGPVMKEAAYIVWSSKIQS
ncbi:hypothetical protein AB4K20DRAFT_1983729 [Rhizopus microsporus]